MIAIRVVLALALLATPIACSAEKKTADVTVKGLAFSPADLTVEHGTKVTWRSGEPITHTVTSGAVEGVDSATGLRSSERPDGTFDGKLDTTGATFSITFDKPATYAYFCAIHRGMNARLVVT